VSCISCKARLNRQDYQRQLLEANAWLATLDAAYAPDGDADLSTDDALQQQLTQMHVPGCPECDNLMKPDVVFFGENVPRQRVALAMQQLADADVLLVAGSSLMVYSGFRFCRDAQQRNQPIIIFNKGVTRADDMATVRVEGECGDLLGQLAQLTTKNMQ